VIAVTFWPGTPILDFPNRGGQVSMKVVCAWCRARIAGSGGNEPSDSVTSHGICPACVENFSFQDGVSLQRFLDTVPLPVLAIDAECRTETLNQKACEVLGKPRESVRLELLGPVFSCAYSRLPEGCGRTIHCSGCAIRKAVTQTFETGEPRVSIPATLTLGDLDEPAAVDLTITTIKADGMVLLRLERVQKSTSEG